MMRRSILVRQLLQYAVYLQSLPLGWTVSAETELEEEPPRPSVSDSLRCHSDDDCVQGMGPGVCTIKALAGPELPGNDPGYRCVCLRGPVFHGCVARRD